MPAAVLEGKMVASRRWSCLEQASAGKGGNGRGISKKKEQAVAK